MILSVLSTVSVPSLLLLLTWRSTCHKNHYEHNHHQQFSSPNIVIIIHTLTINGTIIINTGLQGYGLTETCAASFLAGPFPGHSGTVGPPVPGTEFRLEGSSELG